MQLNACLPEGDCCLGKVAKKEVDLESIPLEKGSNSSTSASNPGSNCQDSRCANNGWAGKHRTAQPGLEQFLRKGNAYLEEEFVRLDAGEEAYAGTILLHFTSFHAITP
eukprot:267835-Prorocentrum_minimum.AAC.3